MALEIFLYHFRTYGRYSACSLGSKKHIETLSKEMLNMGVRVGRPFPPFYNWCRVSTGTSQEVDKFINSMLDLYS